jgi:hypothetical protein
VLTPINDHVVEPTRYKSVSKSWLKVQGEDKGEVFIGWISRNNTRIGPGC